MAAIMPTIARPINAENTSIGTANRSPRGRRLASSTPAMNIPGSANARFKGTCTGLTLKPSADALGGGTPALRAHAISAHHSRANSVAVCTVVDSGGSPPEPGDGFDFFSCRKASAPPKRA